MGILGRTWDRLKPGSKEAEPQKVVLDPNHPPEVQVYQPRPGAPERLCHCHGRPLIAGQQVVIAWRGDVKGAAYIFCEESGIHL